MFTKLNQTLTSFFCGFSSKFEKSPVTYDFSEHVLSDENWAEAFAKSFTSQAEFYPELTQAQLQSLIDKNKFELARNFESLEHINSQIKKIWEKCIPPADLNTSDSDETKQNEINFSNLNFYRQVKRKIQADIKKDSELQSTLKKMRKFAKV